MRVPSTENRIVRLRYGLDHCVSLPKGNALLVHYKHMDALGVLYTEKCIATEAEECIASHFYKGIHCACVLRRIELCVCITDGIIMYPFHRGSALLIPDTNEYIAIPSAKECIVPLLQRMDPLFVY